MSTTSTEKAPQTRINSGKNEKPARGGLFVNGADDGSRTHQKARFYAVFVVFVLHFVLHASKKNWSLFRIASFLASLSVCW